MAMAWLPTTTRNKATKENVSCGACEHVESDTRNVRWKDIDVGHDLTTVREYVPTDDSDVESDLEDGFFVERKSCCNVA